MKKSNMSQGGNASSSPLLERSGNGKNCANELKKSSSIEGLPTKKKEAADGNKKTVEDGEERKDVTVTDGEVDMLKSLGGNNDRESTMENEGSTGNCKLANNPAIQDSKQDNNHKTSSVSQ